MCTAAARAWRWFESLEPWRASLLIFGGGMLVRLVLVLTRHSYLKTERFEMERVALAFAHQGALADPYLIPTGPTAHVSPLYALLLGVIFRLMGSGAAGELVKEFCSSAAACAQYALLPVVCPALHIVRRAGLLAGVAGAALPLKLTTETSGDWEAPFAAVALLLLTALFARIYRSGHFTVRGGILQGAGWGAALLLSSALLPVFLAFLTFGFLGSSRKGRLGRKAYLGYAAASLAVAGLCLAPWAWRNARQLGAPIFTRSNFGLELRLSNNDLAGPWEPLNYQRGVYHVFHPSQSLREAEAVRARGEVAYSRECLRQALLWIRTHPRRMAELTAGRFLYTWFPPTGQPLRDGLFWLLTVSAGVGMVCLWRSSWQSALLLCLCLAAYTAVFYVIHVNLRYRYPVDWILLLCAFYPWREPRP